jgi:predicted DNA-binding protein (MmcQ/YjbR family)
VTTQRQIADYCLAKKGAYADFPFGPDFLVIKVKAEGQTSGRIFAQLFELRGEPKATFNCTAGEGLHYREKYEGNVTRGYHCPPIMQPYFNTVALDGTVSDEDILIMIDNSYAYVISRMPKYLQKRLLPE